jgi:hypothetical protein
MSVGFSVIARNVITKEIGKITEKISRPNSDLDDIVAKTMNLLHAGAKTCSPQKRYRFVYFVLFFYLL